MDEDPGRGKKARDVGRRSGTRDKGQGRGKKLWDKGRRSETKGRNTL